VKLAVCPAVTVWFAGAVVIVGATAAAFTVSVAAALVTVPAVLLTPLQIVGDARELGLIVSQHREDRADRYVHIGV